MNLNLAHPSEVGIEEEWLIRFLSRLEQQALPMHSALIMRHGKVCMETYYKPYAKDTLHRMFSVTKSLISMAIGILIGEGKLSLSDHITDYFPEKQPSDGPYTYTAMLTIRDMLEMKTCHAKTTYKQPGVTDWVESFFTIPPSHVPGTSFAYDTSSTHVLGALVEKLTGQSVLDFMRGACLDELGFSKDAYILTDPCGVSMGGSGLCATTRDLLILMMLVAGNGKVNGTQYIPEDYMADARSKHSDPFANQGTWEEMQGYGYQIWLTRHGGNVLFGMGGQLAAYFPNEDIYMITTADTQGRQGGVQLIYESFYEEILDRLAGRQTYPTPDMTFNDYCKSRRIVSPAGCTTSPVAAVINNKEYICDSNRSGFRSVKVELDTDAGTGKFIYTTARSESEPAASAGKKASTIADSKTSTIAGSVSTLENVIEFMLGGTYGSSTPVSSTPVSSTPVCSAADSDITTAASSSCAYENCTHTFPVYGYNYIANATWRMDNYLLIKVNIIDSEVGSLYIGLNYKDSYLTVVLRKVLEDKFDEFNCVFSAKVHNLTHHAADGLSTKA